MPFRSLPSNWERDSQNDETKWFWLSCNFKTRVFQSFVFPARCQSSSWKLFTLVKSSYSQINSSHLNTKALIKIVLSCIVAMLFRAFLVSGFRVVRQTWRKKLNRVFFLIQTVLFLWMWCFRIYEKVSCKNLCFLEIEKTGIWSLTNIQNFPRCLTRKGG